MHQTLVNIRDRLDAVIQALQAHVPNDEPIGVAHGNWSFPAISRGDLIEEASEAIDFIDAHETDELGESETRIADYIRRLDHLDSHTIPNLWGNAAQAVPAFQTTMGGLRKALLPLSENDGPAETQRRLRQIRRQLRGMEADLNEVAPRMATLTEMVGRIEQAYTAADELPADLESLREARETVGSLVRASSGDRDQIAAIRGHADDVNSLLDDHAAEAKSVLERCETAYSAATSVGLAKAFADRSTELHRSMWFWIAGLLGALAAAWFLGSPQFQALSGTLSSTEGSATTIVVQAILSLMSVGAPVWFAWLSTKQIGQRFRLAEDYAYKASIARAYEGFRREAARIDLEMEAKLLGSALDRLDELPLRLVEEKSHGSPWHELASSDVVKKAMNQVPGFAGEVKALATKAIALATPRKKAPTETKDE